jgi:hypothetical protein
MKTSVTKGGVTHRIEKDANEISDLDVRFISLVGRGANRIPFRVLKSESDMSIDLNKIFAKKQEAVAELKPRVVAVVVSQKSLAPAVAAVLAKQGQVVVSTKEEGDGAILHLTAEAIPDNVMVIKSSETTAYVVENAKKGFESYPDSGDFLENIGTASFFPGLQLASDVLWQTVFNLVYGSEDVSDTSTPPVEQLGVALDQFKAYVLGLLSSVPVEVFKSDDIFVPKKVDVQKTEVDTGNQEVVATKGEAVAATTGTQEEVAATETTAAAATTETAPVAEVTAPIVETVAEVVTEVATTGTTEVVQKADTDLLTQIKGMLEDAMKPVLQQVSKTDSAISALSDKVQVIENSTATVNQKLVQVEQVAKSAEAAVAGTVAGDAPADLPLNAHGMRVRKQEANPNDLWGGALDKLQL